MSSTKQETFDTPEEPWKDENTLKGLYHGDDLNQSEIAEELGTNPSTISYWMSKFEIKTTHSSYGNDDRGGEGIECMNYEDCGNITPAPNNGICDTCLDEARERDSGR